MKDKIMTVEGLIDTDELGVTLPHEHLLIDARVLWQEPTEASLKKIAFAPIDITHLGILRYDPFLSQDNCLINDINVAIEELKEFKKLGGSSLVDVTNIGIGRDPLALYQISRETSVHIIMGCSYYIEEARPPSIQTQSIDEIAEDIVKDITEGVGDTGIRAGIIGEVATGFPISASDEKVLRASARASLQTGVSLSIHLWEFEKAGLQVLDILEEEGVNPSRVVMAHLNPNLTGHLQYHIEMAKRGAFLEFDEFGHESYQRFGSMGSYPIPCDYDYCVHIVRLIEAGFLNQILISQDICFKICLTRYGGFGYGHILRNIKPMLLKNFGLAEREVQTLLEENPRTLLAIQ